MRRRLQASKQQNNTKDASSRPVSQPGSMLKIYTDDSPGIKMYIFILMKYL